MISIKEHLTISGQTKIIANKKRLSAIYKFNN